MPPFEEETPARTQKNPTRAPEAPAPPESPGSPAPDSSGGGVSRHGRTLLLVAVALGFVIALLSSSIKNTLTAFYVSMTEDFDVSRGTFAIAPSAFMLTYAIASPVMGFVADRFGARKSLAGGLVLGGVLFLAGGLTQSFAVFTLVYGVGLAVSYTAVSYVPLGVLVDELFPPHRRGVTYAILMNGTAVGFVALLPLWIHLDEGTVWRSVFQWLGVILLVVTVVALLVLPKEPSAQAASEGGAAPERKSSAGMLSEVLGSRVFWTVSLAFFGCGVTMAFVDVHLVAHLDHIGLGGSVAGTTVALLGAAEIVGALIAGYYCDRGHGLKVLAGSYLVRSLSLVVLMAAPTALAANVFGLLFGITYLGTVVASSMYLINSLDARAKGLALGLMWFIHQIGAFVASEGGGISYDTLQSYDPVVVGSAVIALVSTVIVAVWLPKALRAAGTGSGGDGASGGDAASGGTAREAAAER